ncbi:hypothetical protein Gohar_005040, partial [Gossypium harknessii]|nr:hypothetical protein [Gossypium harknessii]
MFQNIARKWGEFISIDEDTNAPKSFMKANIQIVTSSLHRIEKIIELKLGRVFSIRMSENDPVILPNL